MIPPDAASRLRLTLPEQPQPTQPTPPAQRLTDVLSDLVPGQRLLAEIQALLPNGTYRAVVGQRDVTLALPFSAKAGDTLELEVLESNGKLALAFVANRSDGKAAGEGSVATRLSQAGQLIGDLLAGINEPGKRASPAPLNGNQPLIGKMPENAAELAPLLKDALAKSGMFYEAHQARWAEGKLPTAFLLAQPQGKFSAAPDGADGAARPPAPGASPAGAETTSRPEAAGKTALPVGPETAAGPRPAGTQPIPAPLVPLVQQQLDALATQTYVWQGQVWPGQNIHWEIHEEDSHRPTGDDDFPERWQTRMRLTLPQLGGIEATLRLRAGNRVEIALTTDNSASRDRLNAASPQLVQQMDAAGLTLTGCIVEHGELPA